MAEYEMMLVHSAVEVPEPDKLISAPNGAVHVAPVKFVASGAGTFKRGTVLAADAGGFKPATKETVATAAGLCILAEDVTTVSESDTATVSAYFEGDFRRDGVIFHGVTDSAECEACLVAAEAPLTRNKIFLR